MAQKKHTGLIFDLDGVIVDTAKYHYLAWKELTEDLGIPFNEKENEKLKGVSRRRSFEILLDLGGMNMTEDEKEKYCAKKNKRYVEYISNLKPEEILPGARTFLEDVRAKGYRTAIGSASKNTPLILDRLGIAGLFDAVVDGNMVSRAKPDPEVFLRGAEELNEDPESCIVFEDSAAGIEAAHRGGMKAVGIGTAENLPEADVLIPGFENITIEQIEERGLS